MEIIKYTEDWKGKWDEFVLESNNGTMFHLQKFFDYHIPGKFTFNHLIFLEKNKIVALLPGAMVDNKFESPIGASYGSIVTKDVKFTNTFSRKYLHRMLEKSLIVLEISNNMLE